jgi:hypothetical protein
MTSLLVITSDVGNVSKIIKHFFVFFSSFVGALSSGVASVDYNSIEPLVLSFKAGDEVIIYSKEAGQNKELWGAEVRKEIFNIELD